mgnify:CR=1 FL=1
MKDLSILTRDDEAARERLYASAGAMLDRTRAWSAHNTGSLNTDGLRAFAPKLADAFAALEARIDLVEGPGFEAIGTDGKATESHSGPIV